MAIEILRTGATGFSTAANWINEDGSTAGNDIGDDATRIIGEFAGTLNSNLAPTFTNGASYLDVLPACTGNVGSGSGSIVFQTRASLLAASTQLPRVRYLASGGSLYLTGEGATAPDIIHYYHQNSGGTANLTGTYTARYIFLEAGRLNIAQTVGGESASYDWVFNGGAADIVDSSTGLYDLVVNGGTHTFRRGVQGALTVNDGTVTIDAGSRAFATVIHNGGTIILRNSGAWATYLGYGGLLDETQAQRPITIGGTLMQDASGLTIKPSKNVTHSNRAPIGSGCIGLT
jgi:hypothetical protein